MGTRAHLRRRRTFEGAVRGLASGARVGQGARMILRDATETDHAAVRALVVAAFDTPAEADLIERLRPAGDVVIERVAVEGEAVIGHAILSRMTGPVRALGLAPLAVAPAARRRGVAAALVTDMLGSARRDGWRMVFVLGDPAYYRRFGFSAATAAPFESPYAGPYLMALVLGDDPPALSGRADYAPAFAALG